MPDLPPDYEPNDYVVIITGDRPTPEDPMGYTLFGRVNYNGEPDYDEFWNDTFLMWELAVMNGGFPDNRYNSTEEDHVIVLYANGEDYEKEHDCPRYDPEARYGIEDGIVDYKATKSNIQDIFHALAYGDEEKHIRPMTQYDFLFVYTLSHGRKEGNSCKMKIWEGGLYDTELAQYTAPINHWRRAFFMQQCHSGGFIDDLEGNTTIVSTATTADKGAFEADDISYNGSPLPENEIYEGKVYHHGEYDFHVMNALRGEALFPYDSPPPVDGNIYDDIYVMWKGVSLYEAHHYNEEHNSQYNLFGRDHPLLSDPGNISHSTFLMYAPLLPPTPPFNLTATVQYVDTVLDPWQSCNHFYYAVLNWEKYEEPDFYFYAIYRDGFYYDYTYENTYTDGLYPVSESHTYYVKAVDVYDKWSEASNEITVPYHGGQSGEIVKADIDFNVKEIMSEGLIRCELNLRDNRDVNISIYDITGRKRGVVYSGMLKRGGYVFNYDIGGLARGSYIILLESGDTRLTEKVIIR